MTAPTIHKIYFLGIGGIGMSALARYYRRRGVEVHGYDKVRRPFTKALEEEGMIIHYDEDASKVPSDCDCYVYTPAIPADSILMRTCAAMGKPFIKRAELLGRIANPQRSIAIAGSHGKTTVSSMVAHVLKHSGFDCTALLGGVCLNYQSNFIDGENDVVVVEADEYDRSFHHLTPTISLLTASDSDHTEIYDSQDAIHAAFAQFLRSTKSDGQAFIQYDAQFEGYELPEGLLTYSVNNSDAHYTVESQSIQNATRHFDVAYNNNVIGRFTLKLGGRHNMENALAAISIAHHLGIPSAAIAEALDSFQGIYRRFELVAQDDQVTFIDDYAHHPEELSAFIRGVRELYPNQSLLVVFQPHLFSRTASFYKEFARALELADEQILLPIYPARELPMEGVSSQLILDHMESSNKRLLPKADMLHYIAKRKPSLICTIGAGDIGELVAPIKEIVNNYRHAH